VNAFTFLRGFSLTVLLITVAFNPAKAQDSRARVQGVVTDPTQAAVADAKVTLTNEYCVTALNLNKIRPSE
jgi:hypothetical protein